MDSQRSFQPREGNFGVSRGEDGIRETKKDLARPGFKGKPEFALYHLGCYFWFSRGWGGGRVEGVRIGRNKSTLDPSAGYNFMRMEFKHTTQGFRHQHNFVLNCSPWVSCRGM